MTEKQFKQERFGYGDKVKVKGLKGEHLIYDIDFESCLIGIFDDLGESGGSYVKYHHCLACTLIPSI